jgi:DNA-binding Lrp family transcriptional regulator
MVSVIGVNSAATKHVKDVAGDRSEGMTMIKIIVAVQVSKEASGLDWARNSIAVEQFLDSCERRSHAPDKRINSGAAKVCEHH